MWQYPTPKSQRGLLNVGLRRKHFVCRFLVFIFLLTLPISSYSLNSNHQENINLRDLVGIWKLCYSPPTNDGGPEVDGGYLVMLPDYTFNRLSNGNDFGKHAPAGVQIGTYKVINGYVYFHITQEKAESTHHHKIIILKIEMKRRISHFTMYLKVRLWFLTILKAGSFFQF